MITIVVLLITSVKSFIGQTDEMFNGGIKYVRKSGSLGYPSPQGSKLRE